MLDTLIKNIQISLRSIHPSSFQDNELHLSYLQVFEKRPSLLLTRPLASMHSVGSHGFPPRPALGRVQVRNAALKGNRPAQTHASSLYQSMNLYPSPLGEHSSPHQWPAHSDSKDYVYFIPHKTSSLFVGHRARDFKAKKACFDSLA